MEDVQRRKFVGPVLRGMDDEIIEALAVAIAQDNPDGELFYEDHGGYVRIYTPGRCRVMRIPAKMNASSGDSERRFWASRTLIGAERRRQWVS